MTSRWIRITSAAYGALLLLYPQELRNKYGSEMIGVFTQQMQSACDRNAAIAAASVALSEVLTLAIPARLKSEHAAIALISVVITATMFLSLTAVMQDRSLAMWINKKFLLGCR